MKPKKTKRTKTVAFDEKWARGELLGIADDLRAVSGRARMLRALLEHTAEFRHARTLFRKGDATAPVGYWRGPGREDWATSS